MARIRIVHVVYSVLRTVYGERQRIYTGLHCDTSVGDDPDALLPTPMSIVDTRSAISVTL